jgi:hypothetical protein
MVAGVALSLAVVIAAAMLPATIDRAKSQPGWKRVRGRQHSRSAYLVAEHNDDGASEFARQIISTIIEISVDYALCTV